MRATYTKFRAEYESQQTWHPDARCPYRESITDAHADVRGLMERHPFSPVRIESYQFDTPEKMERDHKLKLRMLRMRNKI